MKVKVVKVLLILTVLFIWLHSLLPADISGVESMKWADRLNLAFTSLHLPLRFDGDHVLRKMAHALEYALLGVEGSLYYRWTGKLKKRCGLHHLFYIGFTVAFLDETIQLFVPGRSGEIRDVWIDLIGFTAAVLITALPAARRTD